MAEKQEVKCDVTENEAPTGSQSTIDVEQMVELSTDIASSDVKLTKSSDDSEMGTNTNMNEVAEELAPSSLTDHEITEPIQPPQTTESSYVEPQEQERQDHVLSISLDQLQQIANSCQEGEKEGQSSTGTASLEGFGAVFNDDNNDDSPCTMTRETAFPPNPQPETPTQPDSATSEPMTSEETEVVINSDEVLASPGPQLAQAAAFTAKEQISTPSTPETDNEQRETIDHIGSHSEVWSSMSDQFSSEQDASAAPAAAHDEGVDANEISDATEQSIQSRLDDDTLTNSQPQNNDVESTPPPSSSSMLESFSEDVPALATSEKPTHAEEEQFTVAATDSTSQVEPEWRDEPSTLPLSEQELRTGVPSGNATEISGNVKTNVEPVFMFPEPPRHPYEPVTVGDDSVDDVFVEPRNDTTASEEMPPSTAMTSSTAAEDSDVVRHEQPHGDELDWAAAAPASPQQPVEEEAVPEQLPTPGDEGREFQVPPTSKPAAAATAWAAEDGERPAEKWRDETRADETHFLHAAPTVDKLESSSSEPLPSSDDLLTAIQSTDAVHQQLDEVPQHQAGRQQTSGRTDRQQLTLLIPEHDSDVSTSDNQVGVYLYCTLDILFKRQISVLRNLSFLCVYFDVIPRITRKN